MKVLLIITVVLLAWSYEAKSQEDSLLIKGEIGIRGQWQTGTFEQFVINPMARITIGKKSFCMESAVNYEFLKVQQGDLINDLWGYLIAQYQPRKLVYPMLIGHAGFAKSYKIDHSILGGLGIGINLIKRKPFQYLQVNLFGGYLGLKFEDQLAHNTPAVGGYTKFKLPLLKNRLQLSWELHAYLSLLNTSYWGINNRIGLHVQIVKQLSIHLSHTIVHNNVNATYIKTTNTKLLFGISYLLN